MCIKITKNAACFSRYTSVYEQACKTFVQKYNFRMIFSAILTKKLRKTNKFVQNNAFS
jgi:hypothetical protein